MRENRTYGLTRGLWGNCPVPYSTEKLFHVALNCFTQRPQRKRNARNVRTRSDRGVYFSWRSWRETNFFFAVGLRQNKNYVNLQ